MASKSSAIRSTNLWTGVATIIAALFSFFALTPDLSTADVLAGEAQKAADAINAKNWVVLAAVAFNVANILYHLFIKKS